MTTKEQAQKAFDALTNLSSLAFLQVGSFGSTADYNRTYKDVNLLKDYIQSHLAARPVEDAVTIKRALVYDLCDEGTDIKDPFVQGLYAAVDRLIDEGIIRAAIAQKQPEDVEVMEAVAAAKDALDYWREELKSGDWSIDNCCPLFKFKHLETLIRAVTSRDCQPRRSEMTDNHKQDLPQRWTKKPVTIEAFQVTNEAISRHIFDGTALPFGLSLSRCSYNVGRRQLRDWSMKIETLEGVMQVSENDYVIKGVKGEIYPCKPDIFEASYTRAATAPKQSDIAEKLAGALVNLFDWIDHWHPSYKDNSGELPRGYREGKQALAEYEKTK